jgi:hypothetical protein
VSIDVERVVEGLDHPMRDEPCVFGLALHQHRKFVTAKTCDRVAGPDAAH